jgi:acyl-coenzyme A thioesterase PaaI-like protein
MLGRLAYRDVALPPVLSIELGMDRIAWHSPTPLRVGNWLRIRLYFDPNFLEPIVLYGHVASAIPDEAGGCAVQAELTETSLETEEAVARLAFLAQRRQLAQRSPQTGRAGR